nr:uncharacterized protein LOC113724387 [Coffea arabica]
MDETLVGTTHPPADCVWMEEERDVADFAREAIELVSTAGNLSPRARSLQTDQTDASLESLNLDQSRDNGFELKQRKAKGGDYASPNFRRLKKILRMHGIKFVAICEPKVGISQIESIRLRLSFDAVEANASGDIWVFHSSPFVCAVIGRSSQHVSLQVQHPWLPGLVVVSFVHARCSVEDRQTLWQALLNDKPTSLPWCVCGDFNVIMVPQEKRGGWPFCSNEGRELLSFMEMAGVFDVGFTGSQFTWCNNRKGRARIWKRLDKLLINAECSSLISSVTDVGGSPLRALCSKLLAIRRVIREWNKNSFGNVFEVVRTMEEEVLQAELTFWSQKAWVKWLRYGDGNSKYFHAAVQQRRVQGAIHRVPNISGDWIEDDEGIASAAVSYFADLFSRSNNEDIGLLYLIPRLITRKDNMALEEPPSMEEVKQAVFRMDGDSAASSDGFTGFIKNQSITENFLLAQEIITGIGRKARGGNVVLKLDMLKAYDRVGWIFLVNVLRKFGFGERFVDTGDPLSLALFVIAAEVLFRGLNSLVTQPGFRGFSISRGCEQVTHLAFADDVIIFANGSSASLKLIVHMLDRYQRASGHLVNLKKCGYLMHPFTSPARRRVVERFTGFSRQHFPIRYLGFPLYFGKSKATHYEEVCQAILGKILSWKSRFLSLGGRIVRIKHVLIAIPMHLLSAAVMPKTIFRVIEKACSDFLWGRVGGDPNRHWIRWSQLCYPVKEGGVGFRKLRDIYTAFSYKLWWSFCTGSSLWAKFLHVKYCQEIHPCQAEIKATASTVWRRMINVHRHVELSIRWLIHRGPCNFWYDNWIGTGALYLIANDMPNLSFEDFIVRG